MGIFNRQRNSIYPASGCITGPAVPERCVGRMQGPGPWLIEVATRIRKPTTLFRQVAAFALILSCLAGYSHAEDLVTLRQDRLFINQLLRRHFFDLARHHCVQQQAIATSTDSKASWQLRLGDIYEQQAWFSVTANRNGLLNHAAEQITEFLEADRPSPEYEFLLRIQQARLLAQAVRMELVVAEGGHIFGRAARNTDRLPAELIGYQARVGTLDSSLELIDSLLRQLEQLRRDLDPILVRRIRDTARLERTEMLVLKYKLLTELNDGTAQSLFEEVSQQIETVSRSGSAQENAWIRLLSAELAFIEGDRNTFQLRVRSVPTDELSMAILPQFLVARSKLRHQEATDALRDLESTAITTTLQQQQLEWLKLECRLGIRELAGELQNEDLVSVATSDFENQLLTAGKVLKGVFREAAERTAQRFNLVNVVGVEVADLVEQVEAQRSFNQPQAALRLIERALLQLPPDSHQAIAALKLRAGEIHIAAQEWPQATAKLTDAVKLFGQQKMPQEQAAADLLHVYVLSQQLTTDVANAQQTYVDALENHLRQFSDQPTAVRAMQWLFGALQTKDTVRAAGLALQLFRLESRPRPKTAALETLGNLLLKAEASAETQKLIDEFVIEFEQLASDEELFPAVDLVVLRLQVLEFRFAKASAQTQEIIKHAAPLAQLRKDLALAGQLPTQAVTELLRRCDLLEAVLTARSVRSREQIEAIETGLMQTEAARLLETVRFLARHHQHSTIQVGDVWLAKMNERLLQRWLSQPSSDDSVETMINLLTVVRSTNELTNDDRLLDEWIQRLLNSNLSPANTIRVAQGLSGGQSSTNALQSLGRFWQNIAGSNPQGSDLWLESQLKLAELSHQSGKIDAAKRRLGVVDALYPDWGTPERKRQVEQFRGEKPDRRQQPMP